MSKWKYAVSAAPDAPKTAPILLAGDIGRCLREAAELGFDAIEYHTRENVKLDYEQIRKTMEETGCQISMIVTGRMYTQGRFSLTSEDPENEKSAVNGMLHYIDMAAEVGAGIVIGWAKGNIREASSRQAYFDRFFRNLKVLDEAATAKNVPINIEVINHYEVDVCMTARETATYLREYGFRSCYVHLDTFHMMLEEEDYPKAIRTAGRRLGYIHLADSTRWYPGSGYIDFKTILRTLDEIGYNGYLSVECFPHDDVPGTARKALQYLRCMENNV